MVSGKVDEDLGPLDSMRHVWEPAAPVALLPEGLSDAIVPPGDVRVSESWMSVALNVGGPVAKSKSTELNAELPFVRHVLDDSGLLFVGVLLVRALLNPLIKVAWNGWEVVESWLVDSVLILASDDEWRALLLSCLRVQVHASARLHACRHWLLDLLREVWLVIAFDDFDLEIDIRMERDGLAADWGPGEGTAIDIV